MEKEISVHLKDEFYIYPEEIEQEQVNDADQQKSKSVKYDARKKT